MFMGQATNQTAWQKALQTPKSNNYFQNADFLNANMPNTTATTATNTQGTSMAGMGGSDWAQVGLGAAGLVSNIIMGNQQLNLAKAQMEAERKQREIENERYNQQLAYHKEATNNAANTASALKSASAQIAKPNNPNTQQNPQTQNQGTQQNAQQTQPNNPQTPNANNAKESAQDLPMERQ